MNRYPVAALGVVLTTATLNCNAQTKQNVLVIVADDLGKEVLSFYETPTAKKAKTPNLDKLAQQGVVFDNFWGSPLSAPVRAAMLTGRYGYHTGIVALDITLPTSEQTIFNALPEGYSNALFGKWHLSRDNNFAPNYGIDYFAGFAVGGGVRDYYNWRLTLNNQTTLSTEYVTSKITNLAKEWIDGQDTPWFCWVAYNAPHTPYHVPPKNTYSQKKLKDSAEEMEKNPLPYYLAMVENLDYEIGRLLEGIDDSTIVIFVGDNGTENNVLQSPYPSRHGKGTLYEAGVSVPMVVAGGGVKQSGTRRDALVTAVDIFPSVLEFAGATMPQYEDGYSFVETIDGGDNGREYLFSEILNKRTGHMCAVSDGRYKIITTKGEVTMMFDLESDPLEQNNLLQNRLSPELQNALNRLKGEMDRMEIPLVENAASPQNGPQNRVQNGGVRGNRPQQMNMNNTNRVR
ncbi:MAG: sulfatase-like hydrolase/transferase [Rikenellaceae bacterium]